MKLDALDHPKLHDLSARLNISRPCTIGHLELLWAFTARYAPDGNLSKQPAGAIARACDWMDAPDAFVVALVDAGWLDRGEGGSLAVHDWADHRPQWVDSKLVRAARRSAVRTAVPTGDATAVATAVPTPDASLSLVKSSQVKPSQSADKSAGFDEFWKAYPKKVGKGQALRAWRSVSDHAAAIMADLTDRKWPEPQFIPNPATYLNGQRWLDERVPDAPRRGDPKPHVSRPLSDADRARVEATQRQMDERAARLAAEGAGLPRPDLGTVIGRLAGSKRA
jgi:hypothetical protein